MMEKTSQTLVTRRRFIKGSAFAAGVMASMGTLKVGSRQKAFAAEKEDRLFSKKGAGDNSYAACVMQIPLHGFREGETERAWIERNAKRLAGIIEQTALSSRTKPRLFVFPVLSLLGEGSLLAELGTVPRFNIDELAVDFEHDSRLTPILQACKRHNCYVASSCVEKIAALPGKYFHTGFILGPEGVVLRSPKTQAPTSPGITLLKDFYHEYIKHFGSDAVLPVAETPIGNLGCLVEGEFLIPEAVRTLRKKGAHIILHPTLQHEGPGNPPYMALRQANAFANGVYWLSAAPSREIVIVKGKEYEQKYGGGSSIVGPDGMVISAPDCEGAATSLIDPNQIISCRNAHEKRTKPADIIYQNLYG